MSSHGRTQLYNLDVHTALLKQVSLPRLDDTPPYTPRSKSLDLLRSDSNTPVASRTSLDTISTLKGQRISSPIFLNSSLGLKPFHEAPQLLGQLQDDRHELDCRQDETSVSFSALRSCATPGNASTRASTMPRYMTGTRALQSDLLLRTPSHRKQTSTDQLLKSKFSMSPVQPSKRSKARNSEDRHAFTITVQRLTEGVANQDNTRSALGTWSHSLGMAARKLQRSALPRKASDESYNDNVPLDVPQEAEAAVVTPEKGKSSLKSSTSLASIRRFITPSRRTRKVSSTRGLAASRRAMPIVDKVVFASLPTSSNSSEEIAWIGAEGRASCDGLTEPREVDMDVAGSCNRTHLMVPVAVATNRASKRHQNQAESITARRCAPLSPEFYEPPKQQSVPDQNGTKGTADGTNDRHPPPPMPLSNSDSSHQQRVSEQALAPEHEAEPCSGASKLKTLQLLARRPFSAFGKKVRGMERSWWPTRNSQEASSRSGSIAHLDQGELIGKTQPARRSEDLLSRASPRVFDSTTTAQKSRSVELDRIQLPSKVVPILSTVKVNYKRRPTIPDVFAKANQDSVQSDVVSSDTHTLDGRPRISNLRHPWMKQLQLPSGTRSGSIGEVVFADLSVKQMWPKMDTHEALSPRNIVPSMSLAAASVALSQPLPIVPQKQQSPRRPPASLLGQSLPIPPRSGRSRASTISSQSSTTSSPSGKVIVSRRSYGQRLRSISTREDAGSIRSVGTSILFTESPPNSPGMRKLMSPHHVSRTPTTTRIRSPPMTVLLPRYSPHRSTKVPRLQKKPSTAFTDDSETGEEQEWMDEVPIAGYATVGEELVAFRSRFSDAFPPKRPGFLEMSEATQTLSNLVKTFSGSSGSLSLHSSPYKKSETPDHQRNGTACGLYGIMEADESGSTRASSSNHLTSSARRRLISIASMVSTEANSSFEDSEELQRLLDSIMAADLGGASHDVSGSKDMALLSPFGSPAEYSNSQSCDKRCSSQAGEKPIHTARQVDERPPPPKFLLNDRPISPPDSSCTSDATHSHCAVATTAVRMDAIGWTKRPDASTTIAATLHDDSGYASVNAYEGGYMQS